MRFTLADMLIATALFAVACLAARYGVLLEGDPLLKLLAVLSVPLILAAAVGVLCHDVRGWIRRGMMVEILLACAIIVWLLAGATG